jgi:G3E family GTPase
VGVKAIESLMEKKGKFDYILLETTGLADPGPIASMFWLDDDLGSEIYLDGIYKSNSLPSQFPGQTSS